MAIKPHTLMCNLGKAFLAVKFFPDKSFVYPCILCGESRISGTTKQSDLMQHAPVMQGSTEQLVPTPWNWPPETDWFLYDILKDKRTEKSCRTAF